MRAAAECLYEAVGACTCCSHLICTHASEKKRSKESSDHRVPHAGRCRAAAARSRALPGRPTWRPTGGASLPAAGSAPRRWTWTPSTAATWTRSSASGAPRPQRRLLSRPPWLAWHVFVRMRCLLLSLPHAARRPFETCTCRHIRQHCEMDPAASHAGLSGWRSWTSLRSGTSSRCCSQPWCWPVRSVGSTARGRPAMPCRPVCAHANYRSSPRYLHDNLVHACGAISS